MFWSRAWQKSLQEARGLFLSSSLLLFRPRDRHLTTAPIASNMASPMIRSDSAIWRLQKDDFLCPPCHRKPPISIFFQGASPGARGLGAGSIGNSGNPSLRRRVEALQESPAWTPEISESHRQITSAAWCAGVAVARGFPGRLPAIFLSQTLVW